MDSPAGPTVAPLVKKCNEVRQPNGVRRLDLWVYPRRRAQEVLDKLCARAKERGHHIRANISRPYRERRREPTPKSPLVPRNLKLMAWNLNTLTSKREVVRRLAQAHKPDVLILTKAGLRLTDHAFQVTDYNAFHRYAPENRQQRKGTGLTLLVHRKH